MEVVMKRSVYKVVFLGMVLLMVAGCGGGGGGGSGTEVEVEDPNYNPSLMTITSLPTPGTYTTSGTYSTSQNPANLKGLLSDGPHYSLGWFSELSDPGVRTTWLNYATGESGITEISMGQLACEKYDAWGACLDGYEPFWAPAPQWEAEINIGPGENLIEFTTTTNGDDYDIDSIVIEHPAVHEPLLISFEVSSINFSEAELNILLDTGGAPCEVNIRLVTDPDLSSHTLIQNTIPKDPEIQDLSISLTDLRPGMLYHCYVSVTNSSGITSTHSNTFSTPYAVITLPATDIGKCGVSQYCATLHGELS